MTSQFQVYKDNAGEFRWRLLAENGKIVASASEGYSAKVDCLNGIDIVRRMRGNTEVYQDHRQEWRWRLTHANGNIIATSGEGYVQRMDCEYGLSLVQKIAPEAAIREV